MDHIINICWIGYGETHGEDTMRSTTCMIHLMAGNNFVFDSKIEQSNCIVRIFAFTDKKILNWELIVFIPSNLQSFW